MKDILARVNGWRSQGSAVALATVVEVERRAPRDPGAALAVNASGEVAGSVSGGCVEPAVIETALDVLKTGQPRLLTFGISDDEAFQVGLSCGGTIHVFVQRLDPLPSSTDDGLQRLAAYLQAEQAVALVTVLGGDVRLTGRMLLVPEDGEALGSTGNAELDVTLIDAARRRLASAVPARETVGGIDTFIQPFTPPPVLHIIGAVHPSAALAKAGKYLGFRVVVCDPRSPFATPERIPDADEIVRTWPDEHLSAANLSPRDAVCVLTHDLKFDVPAIVTALRTPVGYIGVMGSRRTHERRLKALKEAGVTDEQLGRLRAPIGLDIGARTPEEMSIAILAEIIAERSRRSA